MISKPDPDPPAQPPTRRAGTPDAEQVDIFHWSPQFETGLAIVDDQHRLLVGLLNRLAHVLALDADRETIDEALNGLREYTVFHFDTEEALMREAFGGDEIETGHVAVHQQFQQEAAGIVLPEGGQALHDAMHRVLSMLTRWLAFHILGVDRRMAKVMLALERGIGLEQAKAQVDLELATPAAIDALIDAVMGMYDKLSARTHELAREVEERKQAEVQSRRAAIVFEHAIDAIVVVDAGSCIVDANPSFCDIVGQARERVLGQPLPGLIESLQHDPAGDSIGLQAVRSGQWSGEVWSRHASGERTAHWMSLSAVYDERGQAVHLVGVLSNISQLLKRHRQMERLAYHDALTGLPNRLFLSQRLKEAMHDARRRGEQLAVCYLDLDGFKPINDRFGHATGDKLLQTVASRLQALVRANDTVARIGGDEFALLLGGFRCAEDCSPLIRRVLAAIESPAEVEGHLVTVTASIGITVFPDDASEPDTLLRHADAAMYLAKRSGRAQYRFH